MGMYNVLFGMNPMSPVLLLILGITKSDIGRFRDAYVSEGEIVIYTRLGGGNRECWCDEGTTQHECYQANIEKLQWHPLYLRDQDDDFDSTYASFYFRIPDEWKEELAKVDRGEWKPETLWKEKLKEIESLASDQIKERYPEIVKILETVTEAVKKSQ